MKTSITDINFQKFLFLHTSPDDVSFFSYQISEICGILQRKKIIKGSVSVCVCVVFFFSISSMKGIFGNLFLKIIEP